MTLGVAKSLTRSAVPCGAAAFQSFICWQRMRVERATPKASMAVPQARLVVDVATLFVCSPRVRLHRTRAQKYRNEDGCFHDVSKLAGTWLGRSTSALHFVQKRGQRQRHLGRGRLQRATRTTPRAVPPSNLNLASRADRTAADAGAPVLWATQPEHPTRSTTARRSSRRSPRASPSAPSSSRVVPRLRRHQRPAAGSYATRLLPSCMTAAPAHRFVKDLVWVPVPRKTSPGGALGPQSSVGARRRPPWPLRAAAPVPGCAARPHGVRSAGG